MPDWHPGQTTHATMGPWCMLVLCVRYFSILYISVLAEGSQGNMQTIRTLYMVRTFSELVYGADKAYLYFH